MTHEPTQDELFPPDKPPAPAVDAAGLDQRCLTGRALCIDKSSNRLTWVVDGSPRLELAVRFGSELTPTREGAFSVNSKSRDHVSSLYDTPMPYAMFFSGGQAVHYSPDFAANGYNGASHGCVNVRDKGAVAGLFGEVSIGDKVIVYRS
jgi:lipoprotein-anchoring transpeptidase ErfK/SrfK